MKKLMILLAILVILVVAGLIFAAYSANSLAVRFKPDLERVASDALKAPVTIGTISASVFPSAAFQIEGFKVGGDTSGESLTLNNLILRIKLLPLLGGALEITELVLDKPEINIVKDDSGTRILGLPRGSKKEVPSAGEASTGTLADKTVNSKPATTPPGLKIDLKRFSLQQAKINFEDTTEKKSYLVDPLNVAAALSVGDDQVLLSALVIDGVALTSIPFKLSSNHAELHLSKQHLTVPELIVDILGNISTASVDLSFGSMNGQVNLAGSGFILESLVPVYKQFAPDVITLSPRGLLRPEMKVALAGADNIAINGLLALGNVGLQSGDITVSNLSGELHINGKVKDLKIESQNLELAINSSPLKVLLAATAIGSEFALNQFDLTGFGGLTKVAAKINTKSEALSTNGDITGVQIEALLAALNKSSIPVTGAVQSITFALNGKLGAELAKSLSGRAALDVRDGKLVGINVAGDVLRGVKGLPFMSDSLFSAVPAGPTKAALESPDTQLEQLSGNFQIGDGWLATPNLTLKSPIFSLTADGKVSFEQEVDMKASISFSPDFTAGLVKHIKEVSKITDADGKLTIPLRITGKSPKLLIVPDVQQLIEIAGKRLLADKGQKVIDRTLDKLLGGSGGKDGAGGSKKKGIGDLLGF